VLEHRLCGGIKALAVVGDLELEGGRREPDAYLHLGRAGVLLDVVQGFLENEETWRGSRRRAVERER